MSSTRDLPAQSRSAPDATPERGGVVQDRQVLRTPPHNLEAEQAVLGTLMSSTGAAGRYFAETLETGITAGEYYRPAHTTIHRAICDLHQKGDVVDPVTVAAQLTERGELSKAGGAGYLHACVEAVPTVANGAHYAEIVRAKAYRRAAIESAQKVLQYAYSEEGSEDDVRSLVEREFTAIVAGMPGLNAAPPVVDDLYLDFVAELEEIQEGRKIGLSYGISDLDAVTCGMRPGNVTVIAAASGVGKSTLALNAAVAAAKTGAQVMFSSLEMSSTELMQKIAAAEGRLALHHLTQQGGLSPEGWKVIERLGRELFRTLPLRVYRPDSAALRDIESAARACVRSDGLDILVVDYLQLVEIETARSITREQAVAAVSRGLKNLSVQLECHVIALSQLNEDGMMRESRAIKNDASVVIKIERPDLDEPESPRAGEVDLVIEKNRFGPRATVSAAAQMHYSRFVDMAQT
ncbi:AAA family ATPase [Streptomyces sp. NBC_01571]|uniref:replicative DNA helicase n=1 Tax=Streptomyces sp. NBC_01571 TaxID=2975883 RepID=UPI002255F279|nr:DnaB-like helicase C-terminal domain-containing protein [Streptomyces sp. NBC_01571]MCX4581471.1 AAA family ATPase [Streptomyces sp. NBC_01571]